MTIGERLLNLTFEYKASTEARSPEFATVPGDAVGREPSVIAADYEAALLEVATLPD